MLIDSQTQQPELLTVPSTSAVISCIREAVKGIAEATREDNRLLREDSIALYKDHLSRSQRFFGIPVSAIRRSCLNVFVDWLRADLDAISLAVIDGNITQSQLAELVSRYEDDRAHIIETGYVKAAWLDGHIASLVHEEK